MKAILRDPFARRSRARTHTRARHAHPVRDHPAHDRDPAPVERDLAADRVRQAGGPVDRASYTCRCGYVFLAPVSTTVACPHCRATQAW
jgi:hypothetical protein